LARSGPLGKAKAVWSPAVATLTAETTRVHLAPTSSVRADLPLSSSFDVDDDAPDEADRAAWAAESGFEWDLLQRRVNSAYAGGRLLGFAGCSLAVPVVYSGNLEVVAAFVAGWERGADELEVELAEDARACLPLDDRADEAAALDRLEHGCMA
jgi:hypothetical protein